MSDYHPTRGWQGNRGVIMTEVKIRKAQISDLETIKKIGQMHFIEAKKDFDQKYNVNWPFETDGNKFYHQEIENDQNITFVVEKANNIVGF